MKHLTRTFAVACLATLLASCASVGGGGGGTATNGRGPNDQSPGAPDQIWPVKTREHVDLWLHGFAMLQEDTTFVPFFKRGYSTNMIVLKNKANVVTQLDANRDRLRARLVANPQLINAQFVPLSFSSWAELSRRSICSRARTEIHAPRLRRSRRARSRFSPPTSRLPPIGTGFVSSFNP